MQRARGRALAVLRAAGPAAAREGARGLRFLHAAAAFPPEIAGAAPHFRDTVTEALGVARAVEAQLAAIPDTIAGGPQLRQAVADAAGFLTFAGLCAAFPDSAAEVAEATWRLVAQLGPRFRAILANLVEDEGYGGREAPGLVGLAAQALAACETGAHPPGVAAQLEQPVVEGMRAFFAAVQRDVGAALHDLRCAVDAAVGGPGEAPPTPCASARSLWQRLRGVPDPSAARTPRRLEEAAERLRGGAGPPSECSAADWAEAQGLWQTTEGGPASLWRRASLDSRGGASDAGSARQDRPDAAPPLPPSPRAPPHSPPPSARPHSPALSARTPPETPTASFAGAAASDGAPPAVGDSPADADCGGPVLGAPAPPPPAPPPPASPDAPPSPASPPPLPPHTPGDYSPPPSARTPPDTPPLSARTPSAPSSARTLPDPWPGSAAPSPAARPPRVPPLALAALAPGGAPAGGGPLSDRGGSDAGTPRRSLWERLRRPDGPGGASQPESPRALRPVSASVHCLGQCLAFLEEAAAAPPRPSAGPSGGPRLCQRFWHCETRKLHDALPGSRGLLTEVKARFAAGLGRARLSGPQLQAALGLARELAALDRHAIGGEPFEGLRQQIERRLRLYLAKTLSTLHLPDLTFWSETHMSAAERQEFLEALREKAEAVLRLHDHEIGLLEPDAARTQSVAAVLASLRELRAVAELHDGRLPAAAAPLAPQLQATTRRLAAKVKAMADPVMAEGGAGLGLAASSRALSAVESLLTLFDGPCRADIERVVAEKRAVVRAHVRGLRGPYMEVVSEPEPEAPGPEEEEEYVWVEFGAPAGDALSTASDGHATSGGAVSSESLSSACDGH